MRSNILQFVLITAIRLGECIGYLIIIIVVEIFPMETRYPGLVIKFQPHHYITEGVLNVLIEKMATLWSPQTGCSSSPSPSRENWLGRQPGLLFTDDKISPGLLCSLSRAPGLHHQMSNSQGCPLDVKELHASSLMP